MATIPHLHTTRLSLVSLLALLASCAPAPEAASLLGLDVTDDAALVEDALARGVELDSINVMTMDYGAGTAPDPAGRMSASGSDAITALHAQLDTLYGGALTDAELWARIGTTPMIGQNDVQSEVFTLDDAAQTVAFARAHGVGMLSMWSINRDHPCTEVTVWAQPGCNGLADVEDWAYARVFAAY